MTFSSAKKTGKFPEGPGDPPLPKWRKEDRKMPAMDAHIIKQLFPARIRRKQLLLKICNDQSCTLALQAGFPFSSFPGGKKTLKILTLSFSQRSRRLYAYQKAGSCKKGPEPPVGYITCGRFAGGLSRFRRRLYAAGVLPG